MLDSGCTNHMTREKDMFTSFEPSIEPVEKVVFGDNSKGEVLGLGKIATNVESMDTSLPSVQTRRTRTRRMRRRTSTRRKTRAMIIRKNISSKLTLVWSGLQVMKSQKMRV